MIRNFGWVVPMVLLCASGRCIGQNASAPANSARPSLDDMALIEIVAFTQLMGHDDSTGADRKYALILCIEASAPPKPVLDAIAREHPHIFPCGVPARAAKGTGELQIDGDPAKPAIRYTLANIEVRGDGAKLEAGYFEAGESAAGYTMTLHRTHGAWRIVESKMNWIS